MTASRHVDSKIRQVFHRVDEQPAPIIEELALLVHHLGKQLWFVIEYAAMQDNILTAREDVERVKLHGFARADGLRHALLPAPATPGPQSLFAEDKTPRDLLRDDCGFHDFFIAKHAKSAKFINFFARFAVG